MLIANITKVAAVKNKPIAAAYSLSVSKKSGCDVDVSPPPTVSTPETFRVCSALIPDPPNYKLVIATPGAPRPGFPARCHDVSNATPEQH